MDFYSLSGGIDVYARRDQSWTQGTQQTLPPGRDFTNGEGSGCFPISLDLEMLECELFSTSETTLIIREGFQISLTPSCFHEQNTYFFLPGQFNHHIWVPAWDLPWDGIVSFTPVKVLLLLALSFCSTDITNNICGGGDDIRWCSAGLMDPAAFWTVLRGQPGWKPVSPTKVRDCTKYLSF